MSGLEYDEQQVPEGEYLPDEYPQADDYAAQQAAEFQAHVERVAATPEQYAALAEQVQFISGALADSPGARALAHEETARTFALVDEALDARAAMIGVPIGDHVAARNTLEQVYGDLLASGETPEEAREFAFQAAAKVATKTETYKDVTERFSRTHVGQRVVPPRKRDV